MASNNNVVPNLAAYQKSSTITLTKPGYEVLFFSRADQAFNPYPALQNQSVTPVNGPSSTGGATQYQTLKNFVPTFRISSDSDASNIPIVTNIQVYSRVNNKSGHEAVIEIVEPQGVEYFKQTIGDSTKAPPDYDHSFGLPKHRIGPMDTIIIKMKNTPQYGNTLQETVFRGVVSNIVRSKSPKGGSLIRIQCLDFSEFMRQMTALPLGLFSTISFSVTGRGLVNNLLRYANRLVSGQWVTFGGVNIANAVNSVVTALLAEQLADGTIASSNNGNQSSNPQHAMDVPPFFWLQYSQYNGKGQPDDIFGGQYGNGLNALASNLISKFASTLSGQNSASTTDNANINVQSEENFAQQTFQNGFQFLKDAVSGNLDKYLTVEDQESVKTYKGFISKQVPQSQLTKVDVYDASKNGMELAEQNAWILSDLYLEKGLVTFEEQQVWSTAFDAAARSMRECYFDIAPKINPNPYSMFDIAEVQDIGVNNVATAKYNPNRLDDIHPNIGIVKYRLSPCFIPYPKSGQTSQSHFRFFDITDDMIMSTESEENEQDVYSAVYGFGGILDKEGIQDYAQAIVNGQAKGLLTFAHTLDPTIERRIGYRFMTDHDAKIKIPLMMYLVNYVLLNKSQLSMFSQTVQLVGNPIIQPGSIVRMNSQNIDYYCTEVTHQWSLGGYFTALTLQYGHQTGVGPTAITGAGIDESFVQNQEAQDQACKLAAAAVNDYVKSNVVVGGVNEQCLISAMWEYMTCRAATSQALAQCTRAYETAHPYTGPAEWITLYGPNTFTESTCIPYTSSASANYLALPADNSQPVANYMSAIINAINVSGVGAYNVTPNTILNIIGHESSWRSNVIAPDLGYGWFQLTGHQSEISNEDACSNFAQACLVACNILLVAMKTNCSSPASASGANWLNGLAAYNSGQNAKGMGAGDYTALVLGEGQRDAILNGQQTPANAKPGAVRTGLACANQTADLTKWPFDVYGPIGMHPSSVANVSPGTTTAQAKQILLGNAPNFATAMNTSVKYMDYLLHKYQNTAFNPNAPVYNSFLTQSDLFSKVIAAWFSDEQVIGAENANACHNAIQQIKKLYDACIACTNSPDTYSPTNLSELHAALDGIIFINPLPGSKIYSGWRCASRPNHQGIDLALDNSYGAAVVACADGVIGQYGYRGARTGTGGYGLQITHTTNGQPNGAESIYYDMGPVYTVQPGATVKRGQTVGYLAANDAAQASTGATETGIHLHWELHTGINSFSPNTDKSNTVNPNAVLYRQGKNDAIPYWGGADTIGQGGY